MAGALMCAVTAQGLLRPRALEARRCWPRDDHQDLSWKYAAPVIGRELTADILWAKTLVYYGDARLRQSGTGARQRPLWCGLQPDKLRAIAGTQPAAPAGPAIATREVDPRCFPCGPDWDRPDFRYLEPLLDALIDVDPGFKRIYRWAAFAVTYKEGRPTQEEFLLSLKYLHRAMERYPDEAEYFWLAGTRYYIDLQPDDPRTQRAYREKSVDLIEQAMRKARDEDRRRYAELAASFNSRLGRNMRARQNLMESIATVGSPETREKLLQKLRRYEVAADFDRLLRRLRAAIGSLASADERRALDQAVRRYQPPNKPPGMEQIVDELRDTILGLGSESERERLLAILDEASSEDRTDELRRFFQELDQRWQIGRAHV